MIVSTINSVLFNQMLSKRNDWKEVVRIYGTLCQLFLQGPGTLLSLAC